MDYFHFRMLVIFTNFFHFYNDQASCFHCSETSLTGEPSSIVSEDAFPGTEPLPPLPGGKQMVDPLDW